MISTGKSRELAPAPWSRESWPTSEPVDRENRSAGKEPKEVRKHWEDQHRMIDAWEQYRALWDGIDFKRQLIDMSDKKVRFAMMIMGALNAGLIVVLTRGPVLRAIPDGLWLWMGLLLIGYGLVTFGFVLHAIEALRPRPEARNQDGAEWRSRQLGSPFKPGVDRPAGLFLRGPEEPLSVDGECHRWSTARVSQLNRELILINRSSSVHLSRQWAELEKVYLGVKVLAVLAAVIMAMLVGVAVKRGQENAAARAATTTAIAEVRE